MQLRRRASATKRNGVALGATLYVTFSLLRPTAFGQTALECPSTSTPKSWSTDSEFLNDTTRSGTTVTGTGAGAALSLLPEGGNFKSTSIPISDPTFTMTPGDFDKDGWTDFVASSALSGPAIPWGRLRVYKNNTASSPATAANWADINFVRTPVFDPVDFDSATAGIQDLRDQARLNPTMAVPLGPLMSGSGDVYEALGAGDFDGDGRIDIVSAGARQNASAQYVSLWLNSSTGPGNFAFAPRYNPLASGLPSDMGPQQNVVIFEVADLNNDLKLDFLIGNTDNNGTILAYLNGCTAASPQPDPMPAAPYVKCSNAPTFTRSVVRTGLFGTCTNCQPIIRVGDVTNDGLQDIIFGSRTHSPGLWNTAGLRIFRGNGGAYPGFDFAAPYGVPNFPGSLTALGVGDVSLDGKLDILVGIDGFSGSASSTYGGAGFYYKNNGTTGNPFGSTASLANPTAPFPPPAQLQFQFPRQLIGKKNSSGCTTGTGSPLGPLPCPSTDNDTGFLFNYDNDPYGTLDAIITDGNGTPTAFYLMPNRAVTTYVNCGEAYSGELDLGALVDDEMRVTGARVTPEITENGGHVALWMTNEDPPNWRQASLCPASTTDYCVTFPQPTGRAVRWKVTMCSACMSAPSWVTPPGGVTGACTTTPTLGSVSAKFDYTAAKEHYRSGAVFVDGMAYVGAFKHPGNRGSFYAIDGQLGSNATKWDAADKLDLRSDASRKLYTSTSDGTERIDFTVAQASNANLRTTLGVGTATAATNVINWARSARFGVGNVAFPFSKLGAVETASPAILTVPSVPLWYAYADTAARTRIEDFYNAHVNRSALAIVGSRDGFIHAFHTNTVTPTDVRNGEEAWGFVPPAVAAGMTSDQSASVTNNATVVTSYPDGSPTLVDVHGTAVSRTIAVVGSGNGGRGVVALDVTETVDDDTQAILGPTPMWAAVPGGGDAGRSYAKPAVARVKINGNPRHVVVMGSGIDPLATDKGRVIEARDVETGEHLWSFALACPLSSDISVFETDDEPATALDGYMDRAVFADRCGNVYKVSPGQDLNGAYMDNSGLGGDVVRTEGAIESAAFFRVSAAGALGAPSPIAGTLATRTDGSTRVVLFFGTGGLEDWPVNKQNAFFAVYADTGEIRSKADGTCTSGVCEKFYGGVVVTAEQVIVARTVDPGVASSVACDLGRSTIQGFNLNGGSGSSFVEDFAISTDSSGNALSAMSGSLYGDDGAIFFTTLGGTIGSIGAAGSGGGGSGSAAGSGFGSGGGSSVVNQVLTTLSWAQLY